MANSNLTIDMITNEALMILHQKANFLGTIDRQYDDSFAKEGAKIGSQLRVRLPNKYIVTDGATLGSQDNTEQQVTLNVTTQKHVPINFTSEELTLDISTFSKRVIEPAVSALVSVVEADVMSNLYKSVYNYVDNVGSSATMLKMLEAGKLLTDNLAPYDKRCLNMNTQDNIDLVDALKGLFNAESELSSNYHQGRLAGPFAGFNDIYENTNWSRHTSGTAAATTGYLINGASQTGLSMTVDGGSTTFLEGDVITIAGVNSIHAETKVDSGNLQQFVITANSGASATTLSISPSLNSASAGIQNVSASPADNAVILKVNGGANAVAGTSMAYHDTAFTFATADLIMPSGVDMASRQVLDGVSIRIVRNYDINNDKFPCRMDILYGSEALRPELAARIGNN